MDAKQKLAETIKRIKAEHPAPSAEAANGSNISEPDKLAEMFGATEARALRRGAKTREDILRRKLGKDY
mgnify:FL=1